MEDNDRILLDRIAVLEHEKEKLNEELKDKKRADFWQGIKALAWLGILATTVFGLPIACGVAGETVHTDACNQWCRSHMNFFDGPDTYKECFEKCDSWCGE